MDEDTVVRAEALAKDYTTGSHTVRALSHASLALPAGVLATIVGLSGSGKSTLLNLLGALDRPTSGRVVVDGVELSTLPRKELTRLRRERIGFVFQEFHLIPNLSALENVALPMEFNHTPRSERDERAARLLERVDLTHRASHRPARLSGGEQQRVAIARALANDPAVILADEPTGNLDAATGHDIAALLADLAATEHKTVIVVTHDPSLTDLAHLAMHLADGHLEAADHRAP